MKNYTSAVLLGDTIFVRGHEDGVRFEHKIKYQPYLFIPAKKQNSIFRTLDGQAVDKIPFESIYEAKEFIKKYEDVANFKVYGNTDFLRVFLYEEYAKHQHFDRKFLSIGTIDIEVASKGGFPNIETAEKEITAITIRHNKDKFYCFATKPFSYKSTDNIHYFQCRDEQHLLMKFLDIWEKLDLDIITGWNIEGFDIPYIVNRIRNVLGQDMALRLSPWRKFLKHKLVQFNRESEVEFPMGIAVLDYIEMYKKFAYTIQETYKLDHVAQEELGEKKVDYSEYGNLDNLYEQNFQLFMDYNIHDVRLVDRLDDKLGLMDLVLTMAYEHSVLYEDAFTTVRYWDAIIHNHMMDKNLVVPQYVYSSHEDYPGAYVKEPIPGKYAWVASFDVASEYPSIIMECNISPETFRGMLDSQYSVDDLLAGRLREEDRRFLEENNLALTANGALWSRDKKGILPELVEAMFADRQKFRNMMKEAKKVAEHEPTPENKAKVATLNNKQMSLKISLNSLYGALANQYFRFFQVEAAAGITLTGQLAIRWIEQGLNKYLNKLLKSEKDFVVAIDTDSNYVCLNDLVLKFLANEQSKDKITTFLDKVCKEKLEPEIDRLFAELAVYINAFDNKLKMKREKISDVSIWTGKKRYVQSVTDTEGLRHEHEKISVTGLEIIKTSTPAVCRKALNDAVKILLHKTEEDLHGFIAEFREEFDKKTFEEIAFPRGVNGLDKYGDSKTIYGLKTPAHTRAALLYNHLVKQLELDKKGLQPLIREGEKIKFCYLKLPNPIRENVIAGIDCLPKEFGLDKYLDRDLQFEKTFIEPLRGLTDAIGWQTEKVSTLESFFS